MALFVMCIGFASLIRPAPPLAPLINGKTDSDFYLEIVEQIQTGRPYYDTVHHALWKYGFASRSVFNWRFPTLAWLLASLPNPLAARLLLSSIAVFTGILLIRKLTGEVGAVAALLGGVALMGSTFWYFGKTFYLFTECWAGILLVLSVILLSDKRPRLGVLAGISALFIRELVLPYVLLSLAFALWERRKTEAIGWIKGLSLYLGFAIWHSQQVVSQLTDADQAMPQGWIRFGGFRFILTTSQMNYYLMTIPLAFTSIYLTIALVGLFRAKSEMAQRIGLVLGSYLTAFSIVGAPFNNYWGLLTAPLTAAGFAYGAFYLPKLIDRAVGPQVSEAVSPR